MFSHRQNVFFLLCCTIFFSWRFKTGLLCCYCQTVFVAVLLSNNFLLLLTSSFTSWYFRRIFFISSYHQIVFFYPSAKLSLLVATVQHLWLLPLTKSVIHSICTFCLTIFLFNCSFCLTVWSVAIVKQIYFFVSGWKAISCFLLVITLNLLLSSKNAYYMALFWEIW
jgi:hypothetical protein